MKVLEIYMCEKCHSRYTTMKQAEECEKSHCTSFELNWMKYDAQQKYPYEVFLVGDDGKERRYVWKP